MWLCEIQNWQAAEVYCFTELASCITLQTCGYSLFRMEFGGKQCVIIMAVGAAGQALRTYRHAAATLDQGQTAQLQDPSQHAQALNGLEADRELRDQS